MASPTGDEAKLRSLLLVCSSSPEHITEVCRASEAVLHSLHSPAQARNFFTFFFPALLQKIFGFQQQEGVLSSSVKPSSSPSPPGAASFSSSTKGWLSAVSSSQTDAAAKALISLLSPSGTLFTSLLKSDKQSSSLRFLFPTERLPDWVQRSLKGVPPSSAPQLFTDRIKPTSSGVSHVQLDIFEYFFFWFAYYAVCKTEGVDIAKEQPNRENSVLKHQRKSFPNWVAGLHHHKPSLPNWATNLHHSSHQQNSNSSSCPHVGPYLQLLQLYIAHFIPVYTSSRASSPLGRWEYDRLTTNAVTNVSSRTDFLVQTFTEFWLVDEGEGTTYIPPSLQLTDAIRIFVNHMNKLIFSSSGWNTSFTYSQILQRPLYRFFIRAFRTWTSVSPVERASGVVDIWLDFLQPWVLERDIDLSSGTSAGLVCGYSERWQNFVCGNYLFYTNLTVYFLEFALKYMHCNLEAMLQMTSKILNVLVGSNDLLNYLRKLDSLFNNNNARSIQKSSGVLAAIWDQLQRLENIKDVDCNWRKEASHITPWNQLQLFSKNGNGGEAILELLILQAEGEMQLVSHTVHASCTKTLEAIKKAGGTIFNTTLSATCSGMTSSPEVGQNTFSFQASRALPQHTWMDIKYKGDWMRRPIESTEIAWLVRLLVQLSDIINTRLGLYLNSDVPALDEGVDVVDQACNRETGNNSHNSPDIVVDLNLPKVLDWILGCVWSTLSLLLICIRGRGWRVNLRYLAKKPIALAVLLLIIYFLKRLPIQVLPL